MVKLTSIWTAPDYLALVLNLNYCKFSLLFTFSINPYLFPFSLCELDSYYTFQYILCLLILHIMDIWCLCYPFYNCNLLATYVVLFQIGSFIVSFSQLLITGFFWCCWWNEKSVSLLDSGNLYCHYYFLFFFSFFFLGGGYFFQYWLKIYWNILQWLKGLILFYLWMK